MNIASYGAGVNSTAMLIGAAERGWLIDLILFADTGGEKPHTYEYLEVFNQWCAKHLTCGILVVKKAPTNKIGRAHV